MITITYGDLATLIGLTIGQLGCNVALLFLLWRDRKDKGQR